MLSQLGQVVQYFTGRLRRVVHDLVWLAVLVLTIGYSLSATASQSPQLPIITVGIADTFGGARNFFDTSIPQTLNQPYYASGQVALESPFLNSQFAGGADIYFGVILPGGTTVHTWSPNSNGTVTLKSGYAPIARARSMLTTGTFNTASVNEGKSIRYALSDNEPKGLYLLFMFLVPTGTDPADIQQWSFVTMQPLYVK